LSALLLFLLSSLGWSIALIPSPEQPKQFLWILIFGLILLIITPLSFALNELDLQCEALLMTLPAKVN